MYIYIYIYGDLQIAKEHFQDSKNGRQQRQFFPGRPLYAGDPAPCAAEKTESVVNHWHPGAWSLLG